MHRERENEEGAKGVARQPGGKIKWRQNFIAQKMRPKKQQFHFHEAKKSALLRQENRESTEHIDTKGKSGKRRGIRDDDERV